MEMKLVLRLRDDKLLEQLRQLLILGDKEFIPPLSSRGSTTQQSLTAASSTGIEDYFEEMKTQHFVLALDGDTLAGFMSFKQNYSCDYIPEGPNLYASTSVVHPDYRGQGLMTAFYKAMIAGFPHRPIYTRTWHTNAPHLKVLAKLGFTQLACLENHRGEGIHTVYFGRKADHEKIRVAVCQFGEETNTFCSGVLELSDLCPTGWVPAHKVVEHFQNTKTYICGALDAIRDFGAVAVPMDIPAANGANFVAGAILSGDCIHQAAERICNELKRRRAEYDCVFFAMHGAACSVIEDDVESFMLRAVREAIGDTLVMSSLDLHGNITEQMVALSDGYIGLKTVPHIDCYQAGYDAARLLCRTMDGQVQPQMALCRIPLMVSSAAGSTMSGVGKAVKEHFETYVKEHGLLDATFFHGFSSADRACTCASVLVVADGYLPEQEARELACYAWECREGFVPESLTAAQAMDRALSLRKNRYVVINESSDNPGSGAPGDGTHLLREMLRRNLPRTIMGPLYDPAAAAICHAHKPGDRIPLSVGGHTEPIAGAPLEVEAELISLCDGTYISASPVNKGVTMRFGPTARVKVGNVEIILVSERFQTFDDRPYLMTGCNMDDYDLVALKSMNHFRAYFAPLCDGMVAADTPGLRPANLRGNHDFKQVLRPIFPLDDNVTFNGT